jgi:small multidrug resistance pump
MRGGSIQCFDLRRQTTGRIPAFLHKETFSWEGAPPSFHEGFHNHGGAWIMNPWMMLLLAIVCETIGTTSMKLSRGFTELQPSVLVVVFYAASFYLMALVLREIDVGVAYAVWAGMGTALIALIGILWFGDQATLPRLASLACIILGVVGLHLTGAAQA